MNAGKICMLQLIMMKLLPLAYAFATHGTAKLSQIIIEPINCVLYGMPKFHLINAVKYKMFQEIAPKRNKCLVVSNMLL